MKGPRRLPERRLNKMKRFADANPLGTVLPCVVHETALREDGTARFFEITVKVQVTGFVQSRALVRVRRLDTREKRMVDMEWFQEALRN